MCKSENATPQRTVLCCRKREKTAVALLYAGMSLASAAMAFLWHWMIFGPNSATFAEAMHAQHRVLMICLIIALLGAALVDIGKTMLDVSRE